MEYWSDIWGEFPPEEPDYCTKSGYCDCACCPFYSEDDECTYSDKKENETK